MSSQPVRSEQDPQQTFSEQIQTGIEATKTWADSSLRREAQALGNHLQIVGQHLIGETPLSKTILGSFLNALQSQEAFAALRNSVPGIGRRERRFQHPERRNAVRIGATIIAQTCKTLIDQGDTNITVTTDRVILGHKGAFMVPFPIFGKIQLFSGDYIHGQFAYFTQINKRTEVEETVGFGTQETMDGEVSDYVNFAK